MIRHNEDHDRYSKSQTQQGEAFVILKAFEIIFGISAYNCTEKSDSHPDEKRKPIDSEGISPIPLRGFDLVIDKCTHTD